jgi:hypothetical protein
MAYLAKASASIRHRFGIDPSTLTDEEFADRAAECDYLDYKDVEKFELAITMALVKTFSNK